MTRQNTVPGRSDAFLRKFTALIVGPLGKHSNPGRINPGFFTIERVLVLLTVVAALLTVASKKTPAGSTAGAAQTPTPGHPLRPVVVSVAGAALSWLAVNLPMAIMNFEAWKRFVAFTEDRGAGLSPFWHINNATVSVVPGMPELAALC